MAAVSGDAIINKPSSASSTSESSRKKADDDIKSNKETFDSESLSPAITRRVLKMPGPSTATTAASTSEKSEPGFNIVEYEYSDFKVKRYAIIPFVGLIGQKISKKSFHVVEEELFKAALHELQSSSVVLVDFFKRVGNDPDNCNILADPKTGLPEFHTICLVQEKNDITIIDPNQSHYSNFLVVPIKELIQALKRKEAVKAMFEKDRVTFYGAGIIRPVGPNKDDARDCTDIAVKIAFTLLEKSKEKENIIDKIKELSNQNAHNDNLPKANDGTCVRALQSFDPEIRKRIKEKLPKAKERGITDKLIFSTMEELDYIFENMDKISKQLTEHRETLKRLLFVREFCTFLELQKFLKHNNMAQRLPGGKFILSNPSAASNEYTQLQIAVQDSDLNLVRQLMHQANSKGGKEKLQALLKEGDPFGQTALHWAVGQKKIEIIDQILKSIEYTALSAQDKYARYTVLHLAVRTKIELLVEKILNKAKALTKSNDLTKIEDEYKQTALIHAVSGEMGKAASMLIAHMDSKALLAQSDYGGLTALHIAVQKKLIEIVRELLKTDVALELAKIGDKNGNKALDYAENGKYANPEIAKLFTDKFQKTEGLRAPSTTQKQPNPAEGATGPSGPTGGVQPPEPLSLSTSILAGVSSHASALESSSNWAGMPLDSSESVNAYTPAFNQAVVGRHTGMSAAQLNLDEAASGKKPSTTIGFDG